MFDDSTLYSLENLSIAEGDSDLPVENPISTPSSSSISSMAEDDVNGDDLQVEPINEANRPLRELLAPDRTDTPSCIVIPPHRGTFHFPLWNSINASNFQWSRGRESLPTFT